MILITGWGESGTELVEEEGSVEKTNWEADPGVKETVEPTLLMGLVRVKVFVSATVEDKVQVETPEALVTEQSP